MQGIGIGESDFKIRYYFDCMVKDSRELFTGLKIMEQEEKYICANLQ